MSSHGSHLLSVSTSTSKGSHPSGMSASLSESSHPSGMGALTSDSGHSSCMSGLSLTSLKLEVGNMLSTSDLMGSDESSSLGSSSSLSSKKHSLLLQPGSASLGLEDSGSSLGSCNSHASLVSSNSSLVSESSEVLSTSQSFEGLSSSDSSLSSLVSSSSCESLLLSDDSKSKSSGSSNTSSVSSQSSCSACSGHTDVVLSDSVQLVPSHVAVSSVADVDVSSILSSGDGSVVVGIPVALTIDLGLASIVPVVVKRDPRVLSDSSSVVPSGVVGSTSSTGSDDSSVSVAAEHISSLSSGGLQPSTEVTRGEEDVIPESASVSVTVESSREGVSARVIISIETTIGLMTTSVICSGMPSVALSNSSHEDPSIPGKVVGVRVEATKLEVTVAHISVAVGVVSTS